jgi:hypothetical protein
MFEWPKFVPPQVQEEPGHKNDLVCSPEQLVILSRKTAPITKANKLLKLKKIYIGTKSKYNYIKIKV